LFKENHVVSAFVGFTTALASLHHSCIRFSNSHIDGWHQESDPKLSRTYWHLLEVSLLTDESLAKPVGPQWEGNPLIKNTMPKSDALDLIDANNAA
jgi:hypothetical protein